MPPALVLAISDEVPRTGYISRPATEGYTHPVSHLTDLAASTPTLSGCVGPHTVVTRFAAPTVL